MKNLKNIKKIPFEIGQLLAANDKFCSLLIDDSNDPVINSYSYDTLMNDKYIIIYPPVDTGSIKDYGRNTYAVILIDSIIFIEDQNIQANGAIYIVTDSDHILLTNNRNRLLELSDEILKTLDNIKLTSAGKINISNINHIMVSEFLAGYRINFSVTDQQDRKAEI